MTTRVDVEELETTKSEKLLAVVLGLFLLIGSLWAYDKLYDLARAIIDPPQYPFFSQDKKLLAEIDRQWDRVDWLAFAFRLPLALMLTTFGLWLLARLRKSASHYLPVGFAFVGSAVLLDLVMAGDYVSEWVDPLEFGPLVLSLFGIAATLVAFYGLRRYLARRLPYRRVRKSECPFCSYPVRSSEFCEGCGRAVFAACARCDSPRRVGTVHCGACGAT
jgi:hypothetical protein